MLKLIAVSIILISGLSLAVGQGSSIQECEGYGPDASTAKIDAINRCKVLATEQLSKSLKIRSTSIETDKDVSYFSSIESEHEIKNLNCKILESSCAEKEDRTFCKVKCKFNLNQVLVKANSSPSYKNKLNVEEIAFKKIPKEKENIISESFTVSVSTIPICRFIQILGNKPRVIQCLKNPMEITLSPEDQKLRFVASKFKDIEMNIEDLKERGRNVQILFR